MSLPLFVVEDMVKCAMELGGVVGVFRKTHHRIIVLVGISKSFPSPILNNAEVSINLIEDFQLQIPYSSKIHQIMSLSVWSVKKENY